MSIQKIFVVGAGLMGSGIAQTCAVWGGGLLAGLIGTKQKRRRPRSGRRKSGDRRKRAVT